MDPEILIRKRRKLHREMYILNAHVFPKIFKMLTLMLTRFSTG